MLTEDVYDFSKGFHDDIRASAHALDALREEVFVEKMGDILSDYGEIESLFPCPYKSTGAKVDGYHYDDEFCDFTLIVSYWLDEDNPDKAHVTKTDINTTFKQATGFLTKSLKGLQNRIDISNEAHDLASLIAECRGEIRSVKIVLITDGITPKREADTETIDGIDVTYVVWDIERTCQFYRTGEREKIAINFADYCGGPLPCVVKKNGSDRYTSYLGFIPGSALADMYAKWGIKMLDMNVRVFLSARGNVNKGIRGTIISEPEMFCAYNNGITVFASSVKLSDEDSECGLISAEDFQIVNGGQTTASLYHTRKKDRANIESILVPMKMTVIRDPEDVQKFVPRISEYSNTQNKVQVADLAANQAPHPEIQSISNSIPAPDPTGGSKQTYWFYERARGSYEEFRSLTAKTPAQRAQFDSLRPKNQKFDKIKFGKVWTTYLKKPHIVSFGGQKNFSWFNEWLRDQKDEDWNSFFKKTVALIILWNRMERMMRNQGFQGYHHNIVAYSLSWLFELTDSSIDLDRIWQKQEIGQPIVEALEEISQIVNKHIRNTSLNVTEYCKKEECWKMLLGNEFVLPASIRNEYITSGIRKEYDSTIHSEKEALSFCVSMGSDAWFKLSKWLKDRSYLTPKARSQCYNMGKFLVRSKEPSIVLSLACRKIWADAEIRGWKYSVEDEEQSFPD